MLMSTRKATHGETGRERKKERKKEREKERKGERKRERVNGAVFSNDNLKDGVAHLRATLPALLSSYS